MAIEGMDAFIANLKRAKQAIIAGASRGLYQWAEEAMNDSKQVVPVKTGALMNTGKVMPPQLQGSTITVEMGYGDESVGYALIVHEEVGMTQGSPAGSSQGYVPPHPINWTRPGSGPKYLENPVKAKQDKLAPRIAAEIQNEFKKLG